MDVSYDSGSSSMAIHLNDLRQLMQEGSIQGLRMAQTNTAGGRANVHRTYLTVRLLSRDARKELMGRHVVCCNVYSGISTRIFRGPLERLFFMCNQPRLQRLYIAKTKAILQQRLPQ